jgi:BirA family biotin operon repressor/biotin-[acetyl-CoA-carboxylase] ligase
MPIDLDQIRESLPQREVVWFSEIPSTMPEAARLAAAGCPSGALVGAEEQSAGQGRHGRIWHSERGIGLYVSIVLRPALDSDSLSVLTLAMGLAVQEAIAAVAGVLCDLRWPNDLLVGGRKCAGILCQTADPAVIVGIGVNVNQEAFPPEIATVATSLRMLTGRCHSREELLILLMKCVDEYCWLLAEQGADRILHLYAERGRKDRGTHAAGS